MQKFVLEAFPEIRKYFNFQNKPAMLECQVFDKESEDNLTEKAMIYNNQMTKRGLTEYQKNIN